MNLRFSFQFAAIAMVSVAALHAEAPVADEVGMLRTAVDEVLAIAYSQQAATTPLSERVRPTLEKYFSFESVTRRAIGPGWRQFTPEQKKLTTHLFTELVIRTYANRFEAGERPGITYSKAVILDPARPTLRELPTTIDYAGKKYAVSYRVEQVGGSWLIYDVNIEGVSMIANWRSQLDPIFQRGGAVAVIAALEKNLSQEPAK
ncbi:MAG: organic solvent transporter [Rariglobus sp.]|jgi:phospholipid transport system substrate-binding protein|nr:organic solvent transporter [Rariglobus sp.]